MASFKFAGGGCCCCPEVLLLTDTTGSMGTFLTTVKSVFNNLSQSLKDSVCKWAVAEYKDTADPGNFSTIGIEINQRFTDNFTLVTNAINGWTAGGGGDTPEEQFLALKYAAENWQAALSGDMARKKVILWAGDAAAHSGGGVYPVRAEVITALTTLKAKVFGINSDTAGAGIDTNGDASAICSATNGQLFNNVDFSSTAAILAVLEAAINSN